MNNQITLKEKVKAQVLLIILYILSKIAVFILLSDVSVITTWKEECKRIIFVIGIIGFITILFVGLKRLDSRKLFCYFGGMYSIFVNNIIYGIKEIL